ncbi:hypothetical protein ACFVHB_38075 [Kitasatospora sp. NPDC127111]|uniref:RCC1 domain-containing protein n=1 Tax=Kitasatospora sp. NPDC127111 TaxID=3345363 RepID=UPI00364024CF
MRMPALHHPPTSGGGSARRSPRVLAAALLAALLLPGGWQQARAADTPEARVLRPGVPGTALSWGDGDFGQLGDGTAVDHRATPDRVCGAAPCTGPLQDVVAVANGNAHSVALRADGTVLAWGDNTFGEIGNGTHDDQTTPTPVCAVGQTAPCSAFLTNVVAVAAGNVHSMALRADGTVVAWGDNSVNQLGDGTVAQHSTPVTTCGFGCFAPLDGVTAIAAGGFHNLALLSDGTVRSWGLNSYAQLGNATSTNYASAEPVCGDPTCATPLDGITAIAAGAFHSLALRSDGGVHGWGRNTTGQLGDGTTTDRSTPARVCAIGATVPCVSYLTGVAGIAGGESHSAAVTTGGFLRTWGYNGYGQLGDGTTTDRSTPVRVCAIGVAAPCGSYLTGATAVTAGFAHTVALRSDGGAVGWGGNAKGQLGDGTNAERHSPVRVCAVGETAPCTRYLDGATAVTAGYQYTAALVRPQADLAVAIGATPEPVAGGANLTYTVTVRNNGPTSAEEVALTDALPANGRFVSATAGTGSCVTPPVGSTDSVKCTIGTLASGATATVTVVVKALNTGPGGITNTARATSTTPDPATDNNTVTITTPVS